jgi:hypothetical protein
MEVNVNSFSRFAIVLGTAVVLGVGCSPGPTPAQGTGNSSADAGPNSRLKYKEEYKKMLNKDGQLRWKPSESARRPEGIPKS